MISRFRVWVSFLLVTLSVTSFVLLQGIWESGYLSISAQSPLWDSPTPPPENRSPELSTNRIRVQDAWRLVYQALPNFPRENTYGLKEGGKVATDNTLVGRLIRYHVFVKGRPTLFRFDWKLTLADYLGVGSDLMEEQVYPSADILQKNPLEGDRQIIQSLNRRQRDELIEVLVNVFNGNTPQTPVTPPSPPSSQPLPQPKPGDARLLLP